MSQLVLISPYSDRKGISHKSKSLFDFFNRLYFSYLTTLTAHFMNFDNYFDKVFMLVFYLFLKLPQISCQKVGRFGQIFGRQRAQNVSQMAIIA